VKRAATSSSTKNEAIVVMFVDAGYQDEYGKRMRTGRCSVHVSCCVLLLVVAMECGGGISRLSRGVNEGAAIECGVLYLLSSRESRFGEVLCTRRLLCFASCC